MEGGLARNNGSVHRTDSTNARSRTSSSVESVHHGMMVVKQKFRKNKEIKLETNSLFA